MLEHLRPNESRKRRGVKERQHRDRHDRLFQLLDERGEVLHLERRVVDEWEPPQVDAEDDDEQETGEEGRHRESNERERRCGVIEERVALHR